MRISIRSSGGNFTPIVQDVIWLFYPGAQLSPEDGGTAPDFSLGLFLETERKGDEGQGRKPREVITSRAVYQGPGGPLEQRESARACPGVEAANEGRRLLRLAVYRLLCLVTGREPGPWGIFTGIRPTKVVHRMLDSCPDAGAATVLLQSQFAVREDRARLITEIALRQRAFLPTPGKTGRLVAVYLGIPFCPTRCLYCSFPSYPLGRYNKLAASFVSALLEEIRQVGEALAEAGLAVQSIYVGGGTPTSLSSEQLEEVLAEVKRSLVGPHTVEFTVEGGRPDSLTPEKLEICRKHGVNRLSVNPQSMHQRTLRAIGREHTVEDIYTAVDLVRNKGFPVLNMDVIIGLPEETAGDVADTMAKISALRPENITVHALAVKRASRLRFELDSFQLPGPAEATAMWDISRAAAEELGLQPYYLYRQKKIAGNLENIGYALPGTECLYNIQIIEEKQTIIGLGVGAGSKWVNPWDWSLVNQFNPKDIEGYLRRLQELIARKKLGIANLAKMTP